MKAFWGMPGTALALVMVLPGFGQQVVVPNQRVYEDGPLAAGDYQAEPPEQDEGLDASTTTDLQYHYRYQTRVTSRRVTAWTTEVTVEAVVLPAKSWNRRLDDRHLLDHEQGHFDLTYIAAVRARLHFARSGRITNTAATSDEAVRRLEDEIGRQMQPFVDAVLKEHEEYDRLTRHGLVPQVQQQLRKAHQEEIARLIKQWRGEDDEGTQSPARRSTSASTKP